MKKQCMHARTRVLLEFENHCTSTSMVKFFYYCSTEKVNLTYQYVEDKVRHPISILIRKIFGPKRGEI